MTEQESQTVRIEETTLDLRSNGVERAQVTGIAHDAKNLYVTYQQLHHTRTGWDAHGKGEVVVVDKAAFAVVARVPVHERPVGVAVDAFRGVAYVLHRMGELYKGTPQADHGPLVSLATSAPYGEVAPPLALEPRSVGVAVNVARNRVYAADGYIGQFKDPVGWLRVVDGGTGQLDAAAAVRLPPEAVAVTYDEATAAAYVSLAYSARSEPDREPGDAPPHNGVAVVDGASEKLLREYDLPRGHMPHSVAVDPVRNRAYVLTVGITSEVAPAIDVLDLVTGELLASIPSGFGAYGQIGTTPGGALVFAATGAAVRIVSARTLDVVHTWPARSGRAPTALSVDPLTGFAYVGDWATGELTRLTAVLSA